MGKGLFKLLFTILIISSCTVQKRLHQPGWNINFRGHWQKSHEKDGAANFDTTTVGKKSNFIDEQKSNQATLKIPSKSFDQSEFPDIKVTELKSIHKEHCLKSIQQVSKIASLQTSKISSVRQKPLKSNSKQTKGANIVASVYVGIGAVICIIGLLIVLSADATIAGSFIILFGALGIALGTIFILIGLIIFLINAVVNNERRIKQQPSD